MAKTKPIDPRRELVAGIQKLARTHSPHQVFRDLMEVGAIALSNRVDLRKYEPREARYKQIMATYKALEERQLLAKLFGCIVMALDRTGEPIDVLGSVFHELELHNHWKGQYFTPTAIAEAMARMSIQADMLRDHVSRRGFFTMCEPTCGAGVMILAAAKAVRDEGFNPHSHMHVTAVDIDALCVHMAYIQCSLWHIPATIIHGNSLTVETWDEWYTPAHIMGGWAYKLRRAQKPVWADLSIVARLDFCQQHGISVANAISDVMPEELEGVLLPAL